MIRTLIRELHTSATSADVIRHVSKKIDKRDRFARVKRDARHKVFRDAIVEHNANRQLFMGL